MLTCPSGLTRAGDVRFGAARTAAPQDDALLDCANEGLRLPSLSEAIEMKIQVNDVPFVWTDMQYFGGDDAIQWGTAVYGEADAVEWQPETTDTEHSYHCVTSIGARP